MRGASKKVDWREFKSYLPKMLLWGFMAYMFVMTLPAMMFVFADMNSGGANYSTAKSHADTHVQHVKGKRGK